MRSVIQIPNFENKLELVCFGQHHGNVPGTGPVAVVGAGQSCATVSSGSGRHRHGYLCDSTGNHRPTRSASCAGHWRSALVRFRCMTLPRAACFATSGKSGCTTTPLAGKRG
jgi:hypothetical protein